MKKVLIVSSKDMDCGGVEAFLMNWIKQSERLKIRYTWVVPGTVIDEGYSEEFKKLGVDILSIGKSDSNFRRVVSVFKFINSLCKAENYDVVHVNTGSVFINASALAASKSAGVKVRIAHSHSSGAAMRSGIVKMLYPLLRFVINHCATKKAACSALAAEALFGKKYAEGAIIIPNCIDAKRFAFSEDNRKAIREQYGLENCFVIGQVARLSPEKNQKFILEILKVLLKKDITVRVLIVGDGPIKDELIEYAAHLGLEKYVVFSGSSKEPEKFYSAMDLFLLPSLYEGLGVVNIEAQASGLYCFVSDNVPCEVNITGNMSFLSLNSSAGEWAEEILKLKSNILGNRREGCQVISNSEYDLSAFEKYIRKLYG